MRQQPLNLEKVKLFEEITNELQLERAYQAVRANHGAPGVDRQTVEQFGNNLKEEVARLAKEVREWRYRPGPVRRKRIEKPGGGERLLGIPNIRDRVLQYSIKMSIEPCFEHEFSESSFGFRPGRSQKEAVLRAKELVASGQAWIVDIDLEKFFDTMNHNRIIYRVGQKVKDKRVLRLIGITLKSGIMDECVIETSEQGAPQGSPLSPLLSNIILDELDKELEKRGLQFCRYADDCNIFVGSHKAGERVMRSITKFIEKKLKLKVNQSKSQVAPASKVKFLGMTILRGYIAISRKAFTKAFATVRTLAPRSTQVTLETQIANLNRWYKGWSEYFAMTELPSQLHWVEAHIRRRLRAQLVCNQKRKRHLRDKLVKLGVSRTQANTIFANRKRWWLAACPPVHKAWPNRWFEASGLYVASNQIKPHWQPTTLWIKFA